MNYPTNYQLIMTAAGGSSWSARQPTLLNAHQHMLHTIKSWQKPGCSPMVRFEMIECCDACNGMGSYRLSKAKNGRNTGFKETKCAYCKGKNSQVHLVDWRSLDYVISCSEQFIHAFENRPRNAIMGGDGTHLGKDNPLLATNP